MDERGRKSKDPEQERSVAWGDFMAAQGPWKPQRFEDGRTVQFFLVSKDEVVRMPGGKGLAKAERGQVAVQYPGDGGTTFMTKECFDGLVGNP